ncbi:unnamed protein product [Durusdinium trenchii]|uniref:Protein kinase domain-containing protein n=1 Tax=Durusdinium trenchii TaxID=1381693 RepID=A0ABP0SCB4_9DINO
MPPTSSLFQFGFTRPGGETVGRRDEGCDLDKTRQLQAVPVRHHARGFSAPSSGLPSCWSRRSQRGETAPGTGRVMRLGRTRRVRPLRGFSAAVRSDSARSEDTEADKGSTDLGAVRSLEPAASRQGQASVLGDSKGTDDPRASAAAEVTAVVSPTVVTYNALLKGLAKASLPSAARQLLQELPSRRLEPTAISFNTCLDACGQAGDVKAAREVLQEMSSSELKLDVVSFNAALNACASAGEAGAVEGFTEMMAERSVVPNLVTYNTLLKLYASLGDSSKALRLLEDPVTVTVSFRATGRTEATARFAVEPPLGSSRASESAELVIDVDVDHLCPVEGYTVLRPLGRGKFSQVSEVQHKGSSKRFAWKHVQREQNPLCEVEVELLRRMQHEHIIGIYDVYSSFGVLDIMLELCAGSGHI